MEPPLLAGTTLGGYTIIDEIARGGFGITYRARKRDGTTVAIKEYFPNGYARRARDQMVDPQPDKRRFFDEGKRAFLYEANTLLKLPQRPGLVRVRAAFEKFETAYCVMEYIEGEPLSTLVPRLQRQYGFISEDHLRGLIGPICLALDAVHSCRLVHRDVKPANVMLRKSDQKPVLIDFGAARSTGQKASSLSMITQGYAPIEFWPVGTPGIPSGLAEGPWSDVFSLCVMIYEMMTLQSPPSAKTRIVQVAGQKPDPMLPLSEALARLKFSDRYSPALVAAVELGCALMPDQRPKSARELARMIGLDLAEAPKAPVFKDPSLQGGKQDIPPTPVTDDTNFASTMLMILIISGIAAGVVALSAYSSGGG